MFDVFLLFVQSNSDMLLKFSPNYLADLCNW